MFGAYVRVSSEEQKKYGHGADAQIHAIKQYCQYNEIIINENNWYIDKGHTGSNENRPEFMRLNDDIKSGIIDGLIVTTTERISRKIVFREQYFSNLLNQGVEVRAINELFDWNTAYGRQQNRSKAVYDQAESELASERTKKALDQSARSGNYPLGKVPRGYLRIDSDNPRDKRIIIDEPIAKVIRGIFYSVGVEQLSVNSVCKKLNESNCHDINWDESTIRKLLKDPIYMGTFVGKRVIIEKHSPAIVTEELWRDAQKSLSKRKKGARHPYFFFGKVFCNHCETKMYHTSTYKQNSGKRYYYYYCPSCSSRVSESILEEYFINNLESIISKDGRQQVISQIFQTIKRQKDILGNNEDMYRLGLISLKEFEKKNNTIKKNIALNNLEIEELLKKENLYWFGATPKQKQEIANYFDILFYYDHSKNSLYIKHLCKAL